MKTFLLTSLFFSFSAMAQINYNNLTYNGAGCPQGTVSFVTSPDGASLSVLFDEFRAEVPTPEDQAISHKNCNLSFVASIPAGMRADALEIALDARGATMLDQGVEGNFVAVLVGYSGLARSRGNPTVIAAKKWRGNKAIDESWIESPKKLVPLTSGCSGAQGKDIKIDIKNHVTAEITGRDLRKMGMISVDSNDVNGLLKLTLKTSPCGGRARMAL